MASYEIFGTFKDAKQKREFSEGMAKNGIFEDGNGRWVTPMIPAHEVDWVNSVRRLLLRFSLSGASFKYKRHGEKEQKNFSFEYTRH